MSQDGRIYLGKQGRIRGPLSEDQVEAMRVSGELSEYTFRWDPTLEHWHPLEIPPPRPDGGPPTHARRRAGDALELSETIEALCFDPVSSVCGKLKQVMSEGCELIVSDPSETPVFAIRSPLTLNLLDSKSGDSVSVRVQLLDAHLRGRDWVYRLSWAKVPSINTRH